MPVQLHQATDVKILGYQAPKDWGISDNKIISVEVVKDSPSFLEVKLEYFYSGNMGSDVSTCGGINIKKDGYGRDASKWSCRPFTVKKGNHSVILHFELLSEGIDKRECSKLIAITFYKNGGSHFYKGYYSYKKAWLTNKKDSLLNRVKQFIHLQTVCK